MCYCRSFGREIVRGWKAGKGCTRYCGMRFLNEARLVLMNVVDKGFIVRGFRMPS